MKRMIAKPAFTRSILAKPQSEFICNEAGQPLIDFVGRVEQLQDDFNTISQRLRLTPEPLNTVNRSQPDTIERVKPEQLDNELSHQLQELYRTDMKWRNQ
jgi:hypothetical protein